MKSFSPYLDQLDALLFAFSNGENLSQQLKTIDIVLDGQPARELRRLVTVQDIRNAGAFFTGAELSRLALKSVSRSLNDRSVILDPACGVGDLLLACAQHLPKESNLFDTLRRWGTQIVGRELHPEFISTAKVRLLLAALREGMPLANSTIPQIEEIFPNLQTQCGLTDTDAIFSATHIVMNPPFFPVEAPKNCSWAGGKVNAAALFMESCVLHAKTGTKIIAILPDVLRSGSRYQKWREFIASRSQILRVEQYGQFDRWADVDVFILELEIRQKKQIPQSTSWYKLNDSISDCIGDHFEVYVGPVVDYRDQHRGPWRSFVCARNLPAWKIVRTIPQRRRFKGRVFSPPFVVVRRTSRKGDKYRTVGTIIAGNHLVAVENHLLVLLPKDEKIETCTNLLRVLQKPQTSRWFDQRISCRHLTVSSMMELPWWSDKK